MNPGNASIVRLSAHAEVPAGTGKGWYSRGYLPHLDEPNLLQSINFRLHDAVPESVIERWKQELQWRSTLPADDPSVVALRQRIVLYEDGGYGACWLRDERIATLVEDALFYFDSKRYRLLAWCIMPNHAHVLIETFLGHPLDKVLHSWKSFTAQKANELLGRQGTFWARDYYDRYIRDDQHFAQAVVYIEQNPVKAGLVYTPIDWRFGSATRRG